MKREKMDFIYHIQQIKQYDYWSNENETIFEVYQKSLKNLEQHEGVVFQKAFESLNICLRTIQFLFGNLLDQYKIFDGNTDSIYFCVFNDSALLQLLSELI